MRLPGEASMFRGRVFIVLGACAVLLGILAAPVAAAPGGNAANAQKCAGGGYLDYTRADGTRFKNAGQCTRYAAQGGTLVNAVTMSVTTQVGTYDGTMCPVTITLLNGPTGTQVGVTIRSDGGWLRPY